MYCVSYAVTLFSPRMSYGEASSGNPANLVAHRVILSALCYWPVLFQSTRDRLANLKIIQSYNLYLHDIELEVLICNAF